MKITTCNVNGIRSALNKGLEEWLKTINTDVLCLQEIKLTETEIVEPIFVALGYHCLWYPAQKKGYAGVGLLSKTKPLKVTYGIGSEQYDNEGRVLIAEFETFIIISTYFPSGTTGDVRQAIKITYLGEFYDFIHKNANPLKPYIICGDVNICHKEIDIHNPKSNAKTSGFLPEERAWVGKFLDSGYVDCFRQINQEPHQYSWWSYRAGARPKNLGWRIDYIFAHKNISHKINGSTIHADVVLSDHCPVSVDFNL
jgi:exodeoxyribonuclease III